MVQWVPMTQLLAKAIAKVKTLPKKRQDEAAEFLMHYAAEEDLYPLTKEQIAGVKKAQASMRRGKFASEKRVNEFFSRFGV